MAGLAHWSEKLFINRLDKLTKFVRLSRCGMATFTFEAADETHEARKRQRVLAAAADVVFAYGYQRTSMDDIARAAEVSRPALYLLFRNKSDIFRAIAGHFFEQSAQAARAALSENLPFEARISGAINRSVFALVAHIQSKPHGSEILDLKNTLAGDLHSVWLEEMRELFAAAFELEANKNGVSLSKGGLDGPGLSRIFLAALEGVKSHSANDGETSRNFSQLVRIMALATGAVKPESGPPAR